MRTLSLADGWMTIHKTVVRCYIDDGASAAPGWYDLLKVEYPTRPPAWSGGSIRQGRTVFVWRHEKEGCPLYRDAASACDLDYPDQDNSTMQAIQTLRNRHTTARLVGM